jgi:nucleotide-binding universal stress UspA family protein
MDRARVPDQVRATGPDPQGRGRVVVGLEEHQPSTLVLRVAADEADLRRSELAVLTVPPEDEPIAANGEPKDDGELQHRIECLRRERPWLSVSCFRMAAGEVRASVEPLTSAALLVVGAHGTTGMQAFGPETMSWRLFRAARCPVMVIPDRPPAPELPAPGRPLVLAGLSGKRSDPIVIRAAYAEARRRHGDLQLLHAYPLGAPEHFESRLRAALDVVVRATRSAPPPAAVHTGVLLAAEQPEVALARQATGAAVLVLAARSGSMAGLIDAAVSRAVIATAPCPVLTIPWLLIDR